MQARNLMAVWFVALAGFLAGCTDAHPMFGPETHRNGAGQPVDPVYGTPMPGYPDVTGGGHV
jgi:hypothetical protein